MATWTETITAYGTSPWRLQLLAGLKAALDNLKAAGCRRAYIDGSFVTAKEHPGDFDACWELAGVVASRLDPVLLIFDPGRAAQKRASAASCSRLRPAPTLKARGSSISSSRTRTPGRPKALSG